MHNPFMEKMYSEKTIPCLKSIWTINKKAESEPLAN